MRSIMLVFLGAIHFVCLGQTSSRPGFVPDEIKDPIYVGELDPLVVRSRSTHPFFLSRGWQEITLEFDNTVYRNVPALFDLHRNILVLKHPDPSKIFGIIPNMYLVNSFVVGGKNFRKSPRAETTFYEVLFEGQTFSFLTKRVKEEKVNNAEVAFEAKSFYFIELDDELIEINKGKDLTIFQNLKTINARIREKDKSLRYSKFNEDKLVKYMIALDEELNEG